MSNKSLNLRNPSQTVSGGSLFTRTNFAILVIAVFLVWISFTFEVSRARTPSDGVYMAPNERSWTENGAVITPLLGEDGNLQKDDIVVAVEGIPLTELFVRSSAQTPGIDWSLGSELTYTVLRDGKLREVPVTLTELDFLSIMGGGWGILLAGTINLIVFTALFIKRSSYPPAQALFLAAIGLFTTRVWAWGLSIPDLIEGTGFWIYQITTSISYFLIFSGGLHFALTFPNRAPILKGKPWIVPAIYTLPNLLYWISFTILWGTSGGSLEWMNTLGVFTSFIPLIYMMGILAAVIAGYRNNPNPEHRAKVRWIAYAVAILAVFGLAFYVIPELAFGKSLISANELSLASLLLTADILIAIFRYQIFDIDIIINRTVVYTVLTVCLGVIYLGSVSVFGGVLRSLTPAEAETAGIESPLTVVSSTLIIVALFTPLRGRIQDLIDRRFYRTKYDAALTLSRLNRSLQEVVELEDLIGVITAVVADTLQPAFTDFQIKEKATR